VPAKIAIGSRPRFTILGGAAQNLMLAVGLNNIPADKGQEETIEVTHTEPTTTPTQWIVQSPNGLLGTVVPKPLLRSLVFPRTTNLSAHAKDMPGQPFRGFV
jgi:hypothetical protein